MVFFLKKNNNNRSDFIHKTNGAKCYTKNIVQDFEDIIFQKHVGKQN